MFSFFREINVWREAPSNLRPLPSVPASKAGRFLRWRADNVRRDTRCFLMELLSAEHASCRPPFLHVRLCRARRHGVWCAWHAVCAQVSRWKGGPAADRSASAPPPCCQGVPTPPRCRRAHGGGCARASWDPPRNVPGRSQRPPTWLPPFAHSGAQSNEHQSFHGSRNNLTAVEYGPVRHRLDHSVGNPTRPRRARFRPVDIVQQQQTRIACIYTILRTWSEKVPASINPPSTPTPTKSNAANVQSKAKKNRNDETIPNSTSPSSRERLDVLPHKRVNVHPRRRHFRDALPRTCHTTSIARILAAGCCWGGPTAAARGARARAQGGRPRFGGGRSEGVRQRRRSWPSGRPRHVDRDPLAFLGQCNSRWLTPRRPGRRHGRAWRPELTHSHGQSRRRGASRGRERHPPWGERATAVARGDRAGRGRRLGRRRPDRRGHGREKRGSGKRRGRQLYAWGRRTTGSRRPRLTGSASQLLRKQRAPQRRVFEKATLGQQEGRFGKHVRLGVGAHPRRPPPELPHNLGVRRVRRGEASRERHGSNKQLKAPARMPMDADIRTRRTPYQVVPPGRCRRH